jgi:methylmalonyl-CoA/ethylmalonyl-CoA epimerase
MPDVHLSRIRQIAIVAKDTKRATAFYRDVLGLPFLFEAPPSLAFFDCGGVRLMITAPEGSEFDRAGSMLYFLVDDIHAAQTTLSARGAVFFEQPHMIAKMPDHDLWLTAFKDSEGNPMALMSEVRDGRSQPAGIGSEASSS